MTVDRRELLAVALDAATRAGALLLDARSHPGRVDLKSSATDPVSDADRRSEELIVAVLRSARPDDGLVGEEGAARPGTSGLRWVVDPLDGTVNYLYGIPAWSVSIACEDDAGALVGVVHDPTHGETFTATRGGGAALDGRPITVNDPVPLARALLATGFSYESPTRREQAAVVAQLLPRARDIRRLGSAALDLCAVACGRVDGYYESTTSYWDWAAGALIAGEAGAVVVRYADGVLAAGPALAAQLRRTLGVS